jgi:hypothetical protein
MLTQKGYLVAIVDNRGAPQPLGKRFRKAISTLSTRNGSQTIPERKRPHSLVEQRPWQERVNTPSLRQPHALDVAYP